MTAASAPAAPRPAVARRSAGSAVLGSGRLLRLELRHNAMLWLLPVAFALAVATVARSASAGAAAGVAAWLITVLSGRVASGRFGTAATDTVLFLPYLAIGAGCAVIALYASRTPGGTRR